MLFLSKNQNDFWIVWRSKMGTTRVASDIRRSNQFLDFSGSPFCTTTLHNHANRIINQASLSHWVAEYNLGLKRLRSLNKVCSDIGYV